MCGRFALYSDPFTLARRFQAEALPELRPRYNIAPTQNIAMVRAGRRKKALCAGPLGLDSAVGEGYQDWLQHDQRPGRDGGQKAGVPGCFQAPTCLIPADGFIEWQVIPGSKIKQPWFITLEDRQPMAFAGLWERWRSPEGEELESCSIIVTDANALMRPIHDRMPVILAPDAWSAWLEPENKDAQALQNLLKPYPAEGMVAWPVSTLVNSPRNDSVECLEALT